MTCLAVSIEWGVAESTRPAAGRSVEEAGGFDSGEYTDAEADGSLLSCDRPRELSLGSDTWVRESRFCN